MFTVMVGFDGSGKRRILRPFGKRYSVMPSTSRTFVIFCAAGDLSYTVVHARCRCPAALALRGVGGFTGSVGALPFGGAAGTDSGGWCGCVPGGIAGGVSRGRSFFSGFVVALLVSVDGGMLPDMGLRDVAGGGVCPVDGEVDCADARETKSDAPRMARAARAGRNECMAVGRVAFRSGKGGLSGKRVQDASDSARRGGLRERSDSAHLWEEVPTREHDRIALGYRVIRFDDREVPTNTTVGAGEDFFASLEALTASPPLAQG